MFRGVDHVNMDAKGRIALPSRHRERLPAEFTTRVIANIDTQSSCLSIFSVPEWQRIEQQIYQLPNEPAIKRYKRVMLSHAREIELDSQGRARITAELKSYAKLEKKIVLVGLGNKIEVWDEQRWEEEQQDGLELIQSDEIPEAIYAINN